MQPLGIFFIDAFNYLEDEKGVLDPRWEMFLAVQQTGGTPIIVRTLPPIQAEIPCSSRAIFSHHMERQVEQQRS